MTDRLKQFIDENRDAFDPDEPGSQVFRHLRQRLGTQKKTMGRVVRWKMLRWAAVVAGLLLVSASVYWLLGKKPAVQETIATSTPASNDIGVVAEPYYIRQITQFREVIGLKQEELRALEKEYPELYKRFVTDMSELDSAYQALRINLGNNPNRDMLLEAMIRNLQLQTELLNQQLLIIKEIKQKNKSHEKNSI